MELATWILVIMLSVMLFIFLVAGVILIVKLIELSNEAKKIIAAGQQIASKTDDIVDNVKGMTSVGGIVKTFANRVISEQERRYAEQDAARKRSESAMSDEEVASNETASAKGTRNTKSTSSASSASSASSKNNMGNTSSAEGKSTKGVRGLRSVRSSRAAKKAEKK